MNAQVEVRLACKAMATRWEVVLYGEDRSFLLGVAEEALDEVRRLERQLSLFITTSETSDLNLRAGYEPVVVDPRFFRLIEHAVELSGVTDGAFDITVAPLMQAWRFEGGAGAVPAQEAIAQALSLVGSKHIVLNPACCAIQFDIPGVRIDLGAIGKGYAIDCAIEIVRDHGVTSGIMHGGTSTVYGLGSPPGGDLWRIALPLPASASGQGQSSEAALCNSALSVSAPHGKYFVREGVKYGHVIDPRTGVAAHAHEFAAVCCNSAAESDALSTALLTLGPQWLPKLAEYRPGAYGIVV